MTYEEAFRHARDEGIIPEGYHDNDRVVLTAVIKNGMALESASDRLKGTEHIALAAVTQNWMALEFVLDRLRYNSIILGAGTSQNIRALEFLSDEVKKLYYPYQG